MCGGRGEINGLGRKQSTEVFSDFMVQKLGGDSFGSASGSQT